MKNKAVWLFVLGGAFIGLPLGFTAQRLNTEKQEPTEEPQPKEPTERGAERGGGRRE